MMAFVMHYEIRKQFEVFVSFVDPLIPKNQGKWLLKIV